MIEVFTDGASAGKSGPSGIGILIKIPGRTPEEYSIAIDPTDNHHAEFRAVLEAMTLCIKKQYLSIAIRTDSQLVDQALNTHHVKKESFRHYLDQIIELEKQFDLFFIKWVPSSQNKKADQLARSAINGHKGQHG